MEKQLIMSGMRPTGKLHIGHYLGVLKNWIELQKEYNCYFAIADLHALTTKFDKTEELKQNVLDVALDWLSCGIDPEISTIYLQSLVPQTTELHIYLSMITPQNWVERDPTLKDMVKAMRIADNQTPDISYGLLGYPVLMSADILTFNADVVPVGVDQLAHLEITRDIARRFNHIYKTDFFKEPKPKLTKTPLIKGLDGQKMGKSFNNDIKISDSEDITAKKIMKGLTDTNRLRRDDAGNPDNCGVIFPYYEIFADENLQNTIKTECKTAVYGCADCKKRLIEIVNEHFRPMREKRAELSNNLDYVHKIIKEGSNKASEDAQKILDEVKTIIKMY